MTGRTAVRACLLPIAALMLLAEPVFAGVPQIYSPHVTQGQTEFEVRTSNEHASGANEQNLVFAAAHAFTSWWRPEIYLARYERADGQTVFAGTELENVFQLSPAGLYWADIGFLLAYEANPSWLESDKLEFGPILEKRSGRTLHTLNLLWERGVGPESTAEYEFEAAYRFRYEHRKLFAPGLEFYAAPEEDAYRAGPVFHGERVWGSLGRELEYDAGFLFPLGNAAPDWTFVIRIEYELF